MVDYMVKLTENLMHSPSDSNSSNSYAPWEDLGITSKGLTCCALHGHMNLHITDLCE